MHRDEALRHEAARLARDCPDLADDPAALGRYARALRAAWLRFCRAALRPRRLAARRRAVAAMARLLEDAELGAPP